MKSLSHRYAWAAFLLVAGAFLLAKNLNVFGALGEAIWGALFLVAGFGFLVWFSLGRERFWRAIAGFLLISIGAVTVLAWQGVRLGDWTPALIMFGLAVGFWTVFLADGSNSWALIPAGTLSVVGALMGVQARLSETLWLGIFFLGLGTVFVLVYLLRFGQLDTGWAGVPAAALYLVGLVTLAKTLTQPALVLVWWPVSLIVIGFVALVIFLSRRSAPEATPSATQPAPEIVRPAQALTTAEKPVIASEAPPASPPMAEPAEQPVDIYTVLAQQPKEGDK